MNDMTEKEEAKLIEELAEFKHDEETNSFQRTPYVHLSEGMKEEYREWARRVLERIKKDHVLLSNHDLSDEEREVAKDISSVFR